MDARRKKTCIQMGETNIINNSRPWEKNHIYWDRWREKERQRGVKAYVYVNKWIYNLIPTAPVDEVFFGKNCILSALHAIHNVFVLFAFAHSNVCQSVQHIMCFVCPKHAIFFIFFFAFDCLSDGVKWAHKSIYIHQTILINIPIKNFFRSIVSLGLFQHIISVVHSNRTNKIKRKKKYKKIEKLQWNRQLDTALFIVYKICMHRITRFRYAFGQSENNSV